MSGTTAGPGESGEQVTIDLPHLSVAALFWTAEVGGAELDDHSAPLALCLHGFPDSAHTWRLLGPQLAARGYRVVAPFSRGYAPTAIPADGDYHVEALVYDALELARALGADDRSVVIGHDWGAMTTHGLAHGAGAPFGKAVAMAVPPIPAIRAAMSTSGRIGAAGLLARQATMSWYMLFNQIPVLSERALDWLVPLLWRRWSPRRRPEAQPLAGEIDHTLASLPTLAHRRAAVGYYRAAARPWRLNGRYRHLAGSWQRASSIPMLYIHGAQDGCLQAALAGQTDSVLPTGSRVEVVDGAGHFAHLDRPDTVNGLITEFLSR